MRASQKVPHKRAKKITPEHMEIIREYGRKARESLELRGIHWWPEPENRGKYEEEDGGELFY